MAAKTYDVLERLVRRDAAVAHPVRRLGRRLAGQAGVELIAARPGPGLLATGGPAANLAIGDGAEGRVAGLAHSARRLVGQSLRVGLDLLVGAPGPFFLAAV